MMYKFIDKLAQDYHNDAIRIRRDFHKYPEKAWLELRTASKIARMLDDMGYLVLTGEDIIKKDARMGLPDQIELDLAYARALKQGADEEYIEKVKNGYSAVVGLLKNGDGPTIGIRFDIDALGILEDCSLSHLPYREGFVSHNEGIMHACGHDGHIAIGIICAKILMDIKEHLHGTIKLIFQPAEEGVMGAKCIADSGILDDIDYLYAAHIMPQVEDYDLFLGMNESFATTKLDVIYHGVSTHAAKSPQLGKNALLSAANCIINLHAIPRHSDGQTRINVGTVHAGTGRNVVAEQAKLEIEVRGMTTELNRYMEINALDIIHASALMQDTVVEVKTMGKAYALKCDKDFMDKIRLSLNHTDLKIPEDYLSPLGASDDFSYMMARVQATGGKATYLKLLTDVKTSLHNDAYDFDEEVLMKGPKIMASIAYYLMNNNI